MSPHRLGKGIFPLTHVKVLGDVMNLAEQNHLSQVDSNSNAVALSNATPASKSRQLVGLPAKSRRTYEADVLKACNWDAMAATIVDDVAFNTRTHKRPKAASLAYWCAYFGGCPEQRMRTVIKHAVDSGLLEVTQKMFNGSYTPHYRYIGTGVEINTPVETNTPHVEINTTITDSINSSNKNLNIQNAGPGNTPAKTIPETTIEQSGKVKTPKAEQASDPFLKICLERKLEFLAVGTNSDNPKGCVLPTLTAADLNTAQRLEHELTKAGLDPLAFLGWLTPFRFQQHTLAINTSMDWSLFVIVSYREMFFAKYREHLTPISSKAVQPIAPVEPVVLHVLSADDYEACNEPPEYVKPDLFDHQKAAKAAAKKVQQQPKASPTMFQHGKPKHAKAHAAH